MDEQLKLIKSILVISGITIASVLVLLGLQVYQLAGKSDKIMQNQLQQLQKDIKELQKQFEEPITTSGATQNQPPQQQTIQSGGTTPPSTIQPGGTQKPSGSTNAKCGDGTCDAMEKANPTLCPTDCK